MSGSRRWFGLAVLVLPCLLVSMDVSVLLLALPFISAELGPSATEQLWIMDVYGFALAGLLITMGAIGDRIGRRKLLLIGAAAFGAASAAAAYSGSAEMLIATRALLGIAGATLMPSTLALVRALFTDPTERKTAIGIWTAGLTVGATMGPIAGGLLLDDFWWGSVFLINLPAMALLLIIGPFLLPETRSGETGRFDWLGSALSLVSLFALVYGIKQATVHDLDLESISAMVIGLGLGWWFIHRQRTISYPLIEIGLFRNPAFSAGVWVNMIGMFCSLGMALFTNQYLQLVLGMRPFTAALWSLTVIPAIAVAMAASAMLAKKVRVAVIVVSGLVVLAAGFVVLTQVRVDSPLWLVLTGWAVVAAGMLVTVSLAAELILTAAPAERASTASAISETGSELGGALGMAILGSVGAAAYRSTMTSEVEGLPAEAARIAEDTLGGLVAIAQEIGADALVAVGKEAFTDGLNVTAIAGCAVALVAAIPAYLGLRHVPVTTKESTEAVEAGKG
ncbi:MFS transporter [Saccharothrix isguenensis]